MAPNTNATILPRESLLVDELEGRPLIVGATASVVFEPAAPVALLPEPDPLAAAEPDGSDGLSGAETVAEDLEVAEDLADADALVELATEEEPDTLTAALLPLMDPALPDKSLYV